MIEGQATVDASIVERIKRIQKQLQLEADGVIGPATLSAIEGVVFTRVAVGDTARFALSVSKPGLKQLVKHEISSAAYYRRHLSRPVFPGGASGVTIGIGYDLGYNSATQIRRDWKGRVGDIELERMTVLSGLKGSSAKDALRGIRNIRIDLETAEQVFYQSTLPRYAAATRKAYPGVEALYADAQAALLSLVYNRGVRMSGANRREMKAIRSLVKERGYVAIAAQIRSMKRLWEGRGLDGLLQRRDDEALLVEAAERDYAADEVIRV